MNGPGRKQNGAKTRLVTWYNEVRLHGALGYLPMSETWPRSSPGRFPSRSGWCGGRRGGRRIWVEFRAVRVRWESLVAFENCSAGL